MKINRLICFSCFSLYLSLLAVNALAQTAAIAGNSASVKITDDAAKNQSFTAFRSSLLAAVKQHDKKFVESILSTEIATGLGAGAGPSEFNKQWDNLSSSSKFWSRMQRVLQHGSTIDRSSAEISVPGVNFPDAAEDINAVVWNDNIELLSAKTNGSVVAHLSKGTLVSVLEPSDAQPIDQSWSKIKNKNGKIGFVQSSDIFSAYDEYATFKRLKGKWRMTWFGFAGT